MYPISISGFLISLGILIIVKFTFEVVFHLNCLSDGDSGLWQCLNEKKKALLSNAVYKYLLKNKLRGFKKNIEFTAS